MDLGSFGFWFFLSSLGTTDRAEQAGDMRNAEVPSTTVSIRGVVGESHGMG